jgi:hypothetical protein
MALRALTDKAEIEDAVKRLERTVSRGARKAYLDIEWPGRGGPPEPVLVYWHQHLELWAFFDHDPEWVSHWCPFGIVSPAIVSSQTMVVQINVPVEGRNFNIQGTFARDAHRSIHYLHTGRVTGGAIPASKSTILPDKPTKKGFIESGLWKRERMLVEWPDGRSREMFDIGQLNHDGLTPTLAAYVHAAHRYRLLMDIKPQVKPQRTVFLSHSNAESDRQWCDEFVSTLKARGRDVWYDQHSMVPGILSEQLTQQIAERDSFVLALSHNALSSEYVRQEIEWALALLSEKGLPRILPVRLDDCPMPPELDQFIRVRGLGDTALSPRETADEVARMLDEWERRG